MARRTLARTLGARAALLLAAAVLVPAAVWGQAKVLEVRPVDNAKQETRSEGRKAREYQQRKYAACMQAAQGLSKEQRREYMESCMRFAPSKDNAKKPQSGQQNSNRR